MGKVKDAAPWCEGCSKPLTSSGLCNECEEVDLGQYKQAAIERGEECCDTCGDFYPPEDLRVRCENIFSGKQELTCEDCYTPSQIGGDDLDGSPPACGVMDGPCWDDLPLLQ